MTSKLLGVALDKEGRVNRDRWDRCDRCDRASDVRQKVRLLIAWGCSCWVTSFTSFHEENCWNWASKSPLVCSKWKVDPWDSPFGHPFATCILICSTGCKHPVKFSWFQGTCGKWGVIPKVQTRVVQIRECASQNLSWQTASLVFQKPLKNAKSLIVEKEIPIKMERAWLAFFKCMWKVRASTRVNFNRVLGVKGATVREGGPEISRGRKANAIEIKALCEKAPLKCFRKGSSLKKTGLAWFRSDMIRYSYHGLNLKWLKEHIILNLDFTDTLMNTWNFSSTSGAVPSHIFNQLTLLTSQKGSLTIESIENMAAFVTYWGQLNVLIYYINFDLTKNNLKKTHQLEPLWHAFEIKTSD